MYIKLRMLLYIILVLVVSLSHYSVYAGLLDRDPNSTTILLPGISFDLDNSFEQLNVSNKQYKSIGSYNVKEINLRNIDINSNRLPFMANLYNSLREVICMVNVKYYPNLHVNVNNISEEELTEFDLQSKNTIYKELPNIKITWNGTKKDVINGNTAIVQDYIRETIDGKYKFTVKILRFFENEIGISLTISYRQHINNVYDKLDYTLGFDDYDAKVKAQSILKTVMIIYGLNDKVDDKNVIGIKFDYNHQGILYFILCFIVTWVVGLLPAVLLRYAIIKTPIKKLSAAILCVVIYIFELFIFNIISVNENHYALILVFVVSFNILTRNHQDDICISSNNSNEFAENNSLCKDLKNKGFNKYFIFKSQRYGFLLLLIGIILSIFYPIDHIFNFDLEEVTKPLLFIGILTIFMSILFISGLAQKFINWVNSGR